jgi:hypothetical protein
LVATRKVIAVKIRSSAEKHRPLVLRHRAPRLPTLPPPPLAPHKSSPQPPSTVQENSSNRRPLPPPPLSFLNSSKS